MRIFISNDDGYLAQGIKTLLGYLLADRAKHEISIVAPDRDRSGASNSLTLNRPLLPVKFDYAESKLISRYLKNCYFLDGTPTDCVHVGITGLLTDTPDIVVSGINAGANMGDDVLYSGTIAAATEGRFLGLPALAISLALPQQPEAQRSTDKRYFETAARFVKLFLKQLQDCPLPDDSILNINVPNLPWQDIKGIQATRLGKRHKSEPAIESRDPRNRRIYWLGPVGKEADAGPGTDFYAIEQGYISITPLKIDLTDEKLLKPLDIWIKSDNIIAILSDVKMAGETINEVNVSR
ncbi:MAG: 5'/3'-nucleotidase SurE [Pseudomonadota bacterium]